jgi:hypothetical protein
MKKYFQRYQVSDGSPGSLVVVVTGLEEGGPGGVGGISPDGIALGLAFCPRFPLRLLTFSCEDTV